MRLEILVSNLGFGFSKWSSASGASCYQQGLNLAKNFKLKLENKALIPFNTMTRDR
jgi:hypothetical protein